MGLDFGSLAKFSASAATFQGTLTIVATLVIAIQFLQQRMENIERANKQLELFIRRERSVNQEGYERLLDNWQKSLRGLAP